MTDREPENGRKAASNRRNSRKSTGPKTPEGKAVVSRNATKHGLLNREALLPDEDGNALAAFSQSLRAELQPVGELESLLVDRIISASWRLRRVLRVEGEIFQEEREDLGNIMAVGTRLGAAFIRQGTRSFSCLSRYETAIERGLYRALHELQRLQALRAGQPVPPPVAVDMDVNVSTEGE